MVSLSTKRQTLRKIKRRRINKLPELPDKKKAVLLFFANNEAANAYRVSEACGFEYSTAHSSIKALSKEGFLQLADVKINEKGVTAKEYKITARGIHRCLCINTPWHDKVLIVKKWQRKLNPNVSEWMEFIEALNDPRTEEMFSSNVSIFLSGSMDLGYFLDVIDESSFDALLVVSVDFPSTHEKVMSVIGRFPRIRERLLKLIEEDNKWRKEDFEQHTNLLSELKALKE